VDILVISTAIGAISKPNKRGRMQVYQGLHRIPLNYTQCKEVVSNYGNAIIPVRITQVSLLMAHEHGYNDLKKRSGTKRSTTKRSGLNFSLRKIIKRSGIKRSGSSKASSWSLV